MNALQDLTKLRNEYTQLPMDYLKKLAIESYALTKSEIKSMDVKSLIDTMIAVEFKNCYK